MRSRLICVWNGRPKSRAVGSGGGVRPRRGRRALVAMVLTMLAVVPWAITRGAEATPGPGGYFYMGTHWSFSPNAEDHDGSHVAYRGSPTLDYISGWTTISAGIRQPRLTPDDVSDWVMIRTVERSVQVSGINGGEAVIPSGSLGEFSLRCVTPDYLGTYCTVPSHTFTITYSWTVTARSGPCVQEAIWGAPGGSYTRDCPEETKNLVATRTVVAGDPNVSTTTTQPLPEEPNAGFSAIADPDDRFKYSFENRSTDAQSDPEDMTYAWDFGGEGTSTDRNPTFRFPRSGSYDVVLTVTDEDGNQDEVTETVVIANGLVVNSTGDAAAEDPEEQGCDTGDLVDDEPECTLRAAIESANATGGGEISFAIDGASTPTIALDSDLPAVTAPTTIDGTTQPGGWVQITGDDIGLRLQAGPSLLTGLAIYELQTAIFLESGDGHQVVGNHIGTDAAAANALSTDAGIAISEATNVTIRDNVVGSRIGVFGFPTATDLTVEDNLVGVGADGVSPLGEQHVGVLVGSPGAVVRKNVVRGDPVGIEVMGPAASGVLVEDNRVGVSADGATETGRVRYGIRVDGAPGARVLDNQVVSDGAAAILVAGDKNYEVDELSILLHPPSDDEPGTVTGGSATIRGNTVGLVGGSAASRNPDIGILSWGGAARSVIEDNTVVGAEDAAVEVRGGADHAVRQNTLGDEAAPVGVGVRVNHAATTSVVGLGGASNEIVSLLVGIEALGDASKLRIEHNTIKAGGEASTHVGIAIPSGADAAVVTDNLVTGGNVGITSEAPNASIKDNQVSGHRDVGIVSIGDDTTVSGSSVTNGNDGIAVAGSGVDVTLNRIGLEAGSDDVKANTGTGVEVSGGDATLTRNAIAGGSSGIEVSGAAEAELRSNRIWNVSASPITVANGPAAPNLTAAVRTTSGSSTRTVLVLRDLPEDDIGTIEVFAGDSCTDPEPRYLMDVTRKKELGDTARLIQIKGNASRTHFVVTYTDADGRTSELSSCADAGTYPDGDGDGSPDPIDELIDLEDNPAAALVVTDDEELMLIGTTPFDPETGQGGGDLAGVAVVDDPDPGGHPSGWSFPHGIVTFRVTGLEPGAATKVLMTLVTDSAPIGGTSYWKYGPASPEAEPSWYRFDYQESSGTGAVRSSSMNVPGIGIRNVFGLSLRDGARGDADWSANGTIVDPGGPVLGAGDPEPPTATTTTTGPTTTIGPVPTAPPEPDPTAPATDAIGAGPGELARTGSDAADLVPLGVFLVLVGVGLVASRHRRPQRA